MSLAGDALALLFGAGTVAMAWVTWRRPFLGLGFLVAGMAFHNFVLMVLLRLDTLPLLVRGVQVWKEFLLVVLLTAAAARFWRARREGTLRLMPLDWLALAFLIVMVVYLLIPNDITGGHATFSQRAKPTSAPSGGSSSARPRSSAFLG